MNNDFLQKKKKQSVLKAKEYSDDISFFKNRSSFGSSKSISLDKINRMNTLEKKFITNYIFQRNNKIDTYIKEKV